MGKLNFVVVTIQNFALSVVDMTEQHIRVTRTVVMEYYKWTSLNFEGSITTLMKV
jgi:hypothetical protein